MTVPLGRAIGIAAAIVATGVSAQASCQSPAPYGPPAPAAGNMPVRRETFGRQTAAVKWEVAGIAGYMTALNIAKGTKVGWETFHFKDEGWFGKNTQNVGVDKLTHAFNTYVLADILQHRIARRSGGAPGTALTAAVLASGLMAYSELWDAHKGESGWGWNDIITNTAGAAFSVARNTVPGLEEKLDFRLLLVPNHEVYTFSGRGHYEQQRYLLALKLAGFRGLERTPLRLVELHAGYYAANFSDEERARGVIPDRRPFIGVGLNLKELFFRQPRSKVSRAARSALDYVQVPYTAVHAH